MDEPCGLEAGEDGAGDALPGELFAPRGVEVWKGDGEVGADGLERLEPESCGEVGEGVGEGVGALGGEPPQRRQEWADEEADGQAADGASGITDAPSEGFGAVWLHDGLCREVARARYSK